MMSLAAPPVAADVIPLIERTLDRYTRFVEYLDTGFLLGSPEENWPRLDETQLVSAQVQAILHQFGKSSVEVGWRSEEDFIADYAQVAPEAFRDPQAFQRRKLSADAHATALWLHHTLDVLRSLLRTILCVQAQPADERTFRWDLELRAIQHGIRDGIVRNFDLQLCPAAQLHDLHAALARLRPEVVHFSGHGETDGIILNDARAHGYLLRNDALPSLLAAAGERLRCLVLNACYTSEAAHLVLGRVPFVVGTTEKIDDTSAISFSSSLYSHIGNGRTYQDAFDDAIAYLRAANDPAANLLFRLPRN